MRLPSSPAELRKCASRLETASMSLRPNWTLDPLVNACESSSSDLSSSSSWSLSFCLSPSTCQSCTDCYTCSSSPILSVSAAAPLIYSAKLTINTVYQGGKGWSPGSTGLMFIPLALGVVLSAALSPLVNKHYLMLVARAPNNKPAAEARLIPMMFSCWCIPIGLFIFAWTSYPDMSYWGPMVSSHQTLSTKQNTN